MKKIILSILAIFTCGVICTAPAFAECSEDQLKNGCVNTAILGENGCSCDNGKGDSIIAILTLVVDIMTIGVGILGVIGIVWTGIQYLTAAGDEAKVRKSKQRMLEIVIGLAVYVVIYALLKWLLPGFDGIAPAP